jgi:hypothetical protein
MATGHFVLAARVETCFSAGRNCVCASGAFFASDGDGAQASPQYAYWQNTFDPKAEWGSCYFDLVHNLTAFAIYELPVGRGRPFGRNLNPVLNAVVGGWNVSPIYSPHGGFPQTIAGNDNITNNSFGGREL